MLIFLKSITKYKAPALLIALGLCFFIFKFTQDNEHHEHEDHSGHNHHDEQLTTSKEKTKKDLPNIHSDHDDHDGHNHKKLTKNQSALLSELASFSFKEERLDVEEKIKDYPASKEELVAIIIAPDPYLGIEIPPHTIHAMAKNQRGALKVLTLRSVAAKESQSPQFFDRIAREAKDNTIKQIARAALKLVDQGSQDPLKDIVNGLGNLDAIPKD